MLTTVLVLIACLFLFLSIQAKLPFKSLCKIGLHAMPKEADISCQDSEYKCTRCGKNLDL